MATAADFIIDLKLGADSSSSSSFMTIHMQQSRFYAIFAISSVCG
jgi:hypothetical protein